MTTDHTTDYNHMTDEELWNSSLGERLRGYADKLLCAEAERIKLVAKRKWQQDNAIGVEIARDVLSAQGSLEERSNGGEGDPWAYWQSPVIVGLRDVIKTTDGTPDTVQEAAKAYIASLQGDEPPADGEKKEATPLDVAGALSYLLTGHPASDRGPFAVHDGDGFHDEPYVILPVDSMRKVLDRLPESTW